VKTRNPFQIPDFFHQYLTSKLVQSCHHVSIIEQTFDNGTKWMDLEKQNSILELKWPKYDHARGKGDRSNEILQLLS
jgi:hypothetical protein